MAGKNDVLKKHHFWILAGLAPLLVLLAVVFLMTGVSGAIDAANAQITTTENEVKNAPAPGLGTLAELDKKKNTLGDVRGQLWKMNWDKQAPFFTWPDTPNHLFDRYNTMKFGTSFRDFITDNYLVESFKPAYQTTYEKLGESIAPTGFKGGWQSVLRWVNNWGVKSPESRQLWLAMEDVWIQRALLKPIAQVNDDLSRFVLYQPDGQKPAPRKRKFVSYVWELDLEVAARDPSQGQGQVLRAKLKNRTNQLQILGVGSAMQLKVWLDPKMDLPPFDFRIEGAGVPGGESIPALDPNPTKRAGEKDYIEIPLPPGTDVQELAKVVQVLDRRTVPVRRLDRLAIGYTSSKDFSKPLSPPPWFPEAAATDPTAPPGSVPPGSGPPGTASSSDGMMSIPGMPGSGSAAAGPGRAGPMSLVAVADLNKKRYVEINEQLRRVPVAFTLVVDQMYVNEVLIAYANSPLRFETVQYHWQRFTESLNAPAGASGSTDPLAAGSSGDGSDAVTATGFTGAGLSSQPPGVGLVIPGLTPPGSNSGAFGGIPGLNPDTLSSVSEAQANSGLIQLTVYGIVTLYERYDPAKKEGDAAAAPAPTPDAAKPDAAKPMGTTPAPMGTTPPAPAPMGTTPPAPMGTTPTTPAPMTPAPMTPPPMATTPAPMTTTPNPTTPPKPPM